MRQRSRAIAATVLAICAVVGQASFVPSAGATPAPQTATPTTSYTVAPGDSLWGISLKLKVSFPALLAANNMTATSLIMPGQQLVAPAGAVAPASTGAPNGAAAAATAPKASSMTTAATTPAPAPQPPTAATTAAATSYTVVSGDYLYGIARNFAVPFSALLAANSFVATSAIFPGRAITIPAGATTTPKAAVAPAALTKQTANVGASTSTVTPTPTSTTPVVTIQPGTSQKVNVAPTGNGQLDNVLAFAIAQLGKPYLFAGAGPDYYDCSGLVMAAYAQAGVQLIHQSAMQSTEGTAVDWKATPILPGDLVFTAGSATPGMISHVGMAINATQWIQSPRPNAGVQIGFLPSSEKILAVRRFLGV